MASSAPYSTLFPYTTLFRSRAYQTVFEEDGNLHDTKAVTSATVRHLDLKGVAVRTDRDDVPLRSSRLDRKSTRLNSSHLGISYAVFCLKKKKALLPGSQIDG